MSHQQHQTTTTLSPLWDWSGFPYPVDYNDHFETPLEAYQDLQPVLDVLTSCPPPVFGKNIIGRTLYDPYYCNGQTKRWLHDIGYTNVIHEKRDFYADIRNHTVPLYDIFITNPPYSDEHKMQCLEFCRRQQQQQEKQQPPYFLLMPAYVATKQYLRESLADMFFLIPPKDYHYHHPEDTGKDASPFTSLWFCGVGASRIEACLQLLPQHLRIAKTLQELADDWKMIRLQNRLNPRQRQRRRKKQLVAVVGSSDTHGVVTPTTTGTNTSIKADKLSSTSATKKSDRRRNSKYRDESGKRKRQRF
jgi:hypothetical protein